MSALLDASRVAFEDAYKFLHPCPDLRRSDKGNYFDSLIELDWKVWQESRKQALEECLSIALVCKGLEYVNSGNTAIANAIAKAIKEMQ